MQGADIVPTTAAPGFAIFNLFCYSFGRKEEREVVFTSHLSTFHSSDSASGISMCSAHTLHANDFSRFKSFNAST